MKCASSVSLVAFVLQHLLARPASPQHARVLGIAGYPYTGKTHLGRAVKAAWPSGNVTVLPTESAVLPRRLRQTRRTDGCAPDGHDMPGLLNSVISLRNGQSVICREYSWTSGEADGTRPVHGVETGGLLIVDGTVAAASPVHEQCDLVIFLSPAKKATWLPLACRRDISERGWEPASARSQNLRKSTTSETLKEPVQRSLFISIRVDPTSWTWFLPGCGLCDSLPGNGLAQAPVTVASCKA